MKLLMRPATVGAFVAGVAVSGLLSVALLLPRVPANAQRGANFPRMQSALTNLQAARADLAGSENAFPGDHFAGHRSAALAAVDQAIAQVRMGIDVGN